MQYASSLPSMVVTYPLPDDSLEPRWQRLGFSPTTGVAIRLKLDIPELLRPYEKPPPMTIGQIEKMPLWAQPPVDDCIMRADWAHVHVNYRARVMREFGQDIFIQYPGWWQKSSRGPKGESRSRVMITIIPSTVICQVIRESHQHGPVIS